MRHETYDDCQIFGWGATELSFTGATYDIPESENLMNAPVKIIHFEQCSKWYEAIGKDSALLPQTINRNKIQISFLNPLYRNLS